MCGIFGYLGEQNNAPQMTLAGLKQLEYRGYDSWGIAFSKKNKLFIQKSVGKIGSAEIDPKWENSWALGHTRWATHGGVTQGNTHPHSDCSKDVVMVHNGIVENYQELKNKLSTHSFTSETDSEVIAHMIEEERKNASFPDAVKKVFAQLKGLNAIIVYSVSCQEMVIVKKGSPLVVGKNSSGFFVASDALALADHVREVYFLEDEDCIIFKKNSLQYTKVNSKDVQKIKFIKLALTKDSLSKDGKGNFLEKEIFEQPRTLTTILNHGIKEITQLAKYINHKSLIFVGCGSAYHASLFAKYLIAQEMKQNVDAHIGSEFSIFSGNISHKNVTIFLSQSGETIDIIEHAQLLKRKELSIACLVNREGSTLDRMCTQKVHLLAGPEQSVLSTKSFTSKIAALLMLVAQLQKNQDLVHADISHAIQVAQQILQPNFISTHIFPLAQKIIKQKNGFTIGKGILYPIALETALKIKEVTYLHYEGIAGGELKHGTIALIEKGIPCIVYASEDNHFDQVISNAIELKSRGAYIIGISSRAHSVFDWQIPVEYCGNATVIIDALVGQLLAYEMAKLLGNDPDKPRNLAKSVTVR